MNKGFTLVEIIVATSIILVIVVSLTLSLTTYLKLSRTSTSTIKAAYLDEEALEAVRFLRNASWTNNIATLTASTTYYLSPNGSTWATSTNQTLIDGVYDRSIVLQNVGRDVNSNIVSSGGTNDPNTKFITATVSWWNGTATSTQLISTYLTNIYNN